MQCAGMTVSAVDFYAARLSNPCGGFTGSAARVWKAHLPAHQRGMLAVRATRLDGPMSVSVDA